MIRSLLRKKLPASRLALTIGLGGSLLALNGVHAQAVSDPASAQAPETAPAERVVITGSNIPTSEEVGASPVDTVDQAVRDSTGQEDVLSVLSRANPAIASGGGSLGQSNASVNSGATDGGSSISIHGLQTLVLLDGRRLTDSSAAALGGASFTDVNLFPSALVKRIEVLKDGASAIYGTEAVGGVVNVILDQEFQGFDFSTRYGFTEKADVKDQRFSGIFGFGDDKTHLVIGAEYTNQDPIKNTDRDFSKLSFGTTTYAGIARFNNSVFQLNPALNSPNDAVAVGSVPVPTSTASPFPAGVYNFIGSTAAAGGFNLANATDVTLDQNRFNFFASADRDLIEKHVVAFADFLYASNYSQSQLNAQPLSTNTGIILPVGAPFNPFYVPTTTTPLTPLNITGSTPVLADNRFVTAPRVFRNDANFYRIVAGLKGEIIPNYNYEIALNASREQITTQNPGLIVAQDINDAIAGGYNAAGVAVPATFNTDGSVATPAGPYSMVRGNLQPALDFFARNNPTAALQNFTANDIRFGESSFKGVDGKLTAFPFSLPAGPVGFAAGGEYRHEFLQARIGEQNFVGAVPIADVDRGRDVFAFFGEAQIPLVNPDQKIPGVYSANLDGAFRFENFSDSGSAWVPKVGFTVLPIKDVALRGSFSKSFVAPTIYQTSGPASNGFTASYDIGQGSEQAQSEGGSNPNLASTRANTYTAGIVLSPHQVPGLTLNGDFFHVDETRITGTIDPVVAIESVNAVGAASPFASFVHLNSFTGPTGLAAGTLAGNGPDLFVTANEQNLGGAHIAGVDFGAHYTHDFGNPGQASVGIDGTYYLQYKESTLAGSNFFDVIGYYTGQTGFVQPYHLTPEVEYKIRGFTASALGNYIPSGRDARNISLDPTAGFGGTNPDKASDLIAATGLSHLPKIRDYYTIDLLFSYEFGLPVSPDAPAPAPAPKDGKDGGKNVAYNSGKDMTKEAPMSREMAKHINILRYLDGLKLSFGIDNVTNARPAQIGSLDNFDSGPDATNTDASIYDPYQRRYYFVVSKKF